MFVCLRNEITRIELIKVDTDWSLQFAVLFFPSFYSIDKNLRSLNISSKFSEIARIEKNQDFRSNCKVNENMKPQYHTVDIVMKTIFFVKFES